MSHSFGITAKTFGKRSNAHSRSLILGELTFDTLGNITLSGSNAILEGPGSLVKIGTGTLTINQTQAYEGTTTISEGTLVLNGSLPNAVTVQAEATIAPESPINTGSLSLESGSNYIANGTINISGNVEISNAHLSTTTPSPRVIITYSGTRSGEFATNALPAGWSLQYDDSAKEIRLVEQSNPYEDWISGYNTEGKSSFNDDADGDGISNGLEFFLGGNPLIPNDTPTPLLDISSDGKLSYQFTRTTRARENCSTTILTSQDLKNWTETDIIIGDDSISSSSNVAIVNQGEFDQITIDLPVNQTPMFIRLKVVTLDLEQSKNSP